MMTNQAIQFTATQRDGCAFWQHCFVGHIDDRTCFTAADVDQQTRCTFHRFVLQSRINTAFITVRGIGMQTMTTRATGDRQRTEECAFQQHVLGFVIHARMFTTKDAAHCQRFVVIGNNQSVCTELRFATVEQNQGFTLFRHTHHDPAFDTIFIESMHRLAQFEQHEVGDVNNSVD
ncbi:hypothetical protein D3C78_817880 [compost metagenome]